MYNSRIGRRTKRISDSKLDPKITSRKRVVDADDDDDNDDVEIGGYKLTEDEVQGLLELLPYKEALIKIAKGEFEIEKVEEAEEDEEADAPAEENAPAEADADTEAEEENFEEDEDFSDDDESEDDYADEEDDAEAVEDSAINDAWAKRLKGNQK